MASTEFCDKPSSAFRWANDIFCPYASGIAKKKIASSNFSKPYCLQNNKLINKKWGYLTASHQPGNEVLRLKMCTMKVNLTLFFKKQSHFVDFFTPEIFMNAPFLCKQENQTISPDCFYQTIVIVWF